jgi:hypothetical protein
MVTFTLIKGKQAEFISYRPHLYFPYSSPQSHKTLARTSINSYELLDQLEHANLASIPYASPLSHLPRR